MTEIIKLTEIEINQTIHKAMGMCWHEPREQYLPAGIAPQCKHCHIILGGNWDKWNPSHTSDWSDYGQAIEWAMKKDWWRIFIASSWEGDFGDYLRILLNPLRGSTALAEFIKEKGL